MISAMNKGSEASSILLTGNEKITHIAAGDAHNLVLTSYGRLFTFGYNNKGQLGQGHSKNISSAKLIERV